MEEALKAAKMELGDDAMLVDSKRLETPPDGRSRLEVIFAASAAPPPPPKAGAPQAVASAAESIAGLRRFRGELTSLLDTLDRRPDAARLEPLTPARPQLDALRARLLLSEVPPLATDDMLRVCRPVLEGLVLRAGGSDEEMERAVLPLVSAEWRHVPADHAKTSGILAFAGPAGAGKTSAIAKLAFRLGVSQGRPVSVLSVDNLRIGASDQLAHLCALLGVPFQSLEYSGALPAAVAAHEHRGLILIDTPGYGPTQMDVMAETAGQLNRIEGIVCHLVLPATLRHSDMQRHYCRYAAFSPSRLLFTRLDETQYFGPAWAMARESRVPVDWVSTGPGIPEDIEEADASQFAASVLGNGAYGGKTAALAQQNALTSAAKAGSGRV